ncbi:MAG TPA: anion transporter [Candidatus Kapabacteria bacterium]|nr:anion transporter [Candidatus Kapabacteria bacterium]
METAAIIIFVITYAGVALGALPGLALDRTGIALLGAIAMVTTTVLSTQQAVSAIDTSTILLLYALMVISAQLRLSGFYTRLALTITGFVRNPAKFLLVMMGACAILSAILANDIICLAFTPVICLSLIEAKINPIPFLIGLAVSSNIGSAATIIGNPQNMLLGQIGNLHFGRFLFYCIVPSLAALAAAYFIIYFMYRNKFREYTPVEIRERRHPQDPYNAHQAHKGLAVVIILIILFFTPVPRELSALALAGFLLCNRSLHSRTILGQIDWHLITLFCALFIVIGGIEATGLPAALVANLKHEGFNLQGLFNLTFLSTFLSNMVSNVPAVMLLVKFLDPSQPAQWYVTALSSTFAGNLFTIGSIANLIVIEGAKDYGISITFKEHARVGIPVTLVSILITLAWIKLQGGA